MKQRSCKREYARYTILSVLGTLGVSCYILADTFFVAKKLGADGLTALNLAVPAYCFMHGTGMMLGMGGATRFSVCKSQNSTGETNRIFTSTMYLALLFSVGFFLCGLLFSGQLASLLGADTSVLGMTDTYLRWLTYFAPAFILNDILLCFVRNDGGPQLSMAAMLIGSFSNILLDYIFIFPLGMGIFGAALATGLSAVISIVLMFSHWIGKRSTLCLVKTKLRIKLIGQVLSLGLPSLITEFSTGIVMIVFNAIILNLEGNTGVAAYGIVANISIVVISIYTGIAQGIQPLVSTSYGIGDNRKARTVFRYAVITVLSVSVLIYLSVFVFVQPITAIFNGEGHPILQQIAEWGLKLYFMAIPFVGYNMVTSTFFTSEEMAPPAHILSGLRGLVLIVPLAFLLSSLWGMTGVWLTYPITEGLVALFGFVLYQRLQKQQNRAAFRNNPE